MYVEINNEAKESRTVISGAFNFCAFRCLNGISYVVTNAAIKTMTVIYDVISSWNSQLAHSSVCEGETHCSRVILLEKHVKGNETPCNWKCKRQKIGFVNWNLLGSKKTILLRYILHCSKSARMVQAENKRQYKETKRANVYRFL